MVLLWTGAWFWCRRFAFRSRFRIGTRTRTAWTTAARPIKEFDTVTSNRRPQTKCKKLISYLERERERRRERDLERLLDDLEWRPPRRLSSTSLMRRPFNSVLSSLSKALRKSECVANSTTLTKIKKTIISTSFNFPKIMPFKIFSVEC